MATSDLPDTQPSAVADLEDRALVALLAQGSSAAMAELHARYARPCLSLARRLLGDDNLAQDAVQEVFLALWRRPAAYDADRGVFASWLLAATHHKAVDQVRREQTLRNRRTGSDAFDELAGTPSLAVSVEDQVSGILKAERVRGALNRLPAVQREALVLAYFGCYTQREIAQLTGTPLGTVKTRMLAAMRRLRDLLDESVITDSSAWGEGTR